MHGLNLTFLQIYTPFFFYKVENRFLSFSILFFKKNKSTPFVTYRSTSIKMVSFTKLVTVGLVATSAMAAPMQVKRTTSSKRGAAYNDVTTVSALTSGGAISWAYNWAGSLSGSLPSNIEFVPMLWGPKMFGGWVAAIETALSSGSSYILGFNEPDMASQANMSPSDAASYYQTYITPWSGKAKLISPAVTSSTEAGVGLDWFESFIGSCSSCGISGLAVHWYGNTADEFKSFVTTAVDTASNHGLSEVWITEFALNADVNGSADPATTAAFLDEVLPWLDSQTGVTRYSYFMCAENYLLSGNTLNAAGQAYVSA
ncbi:glycoside hydrolase family protein [Pseudomonas aeruginosa]|nr:glycoside hydrolase family protein [Pseudomonas aeruginosa]